MTFRFFGAYQKRLFTKFFKGQKYFENVKKIQASGIEDESNVSSNDEVHEKYLTNIRRPDLNINCDTSFVRFTSSS